jgi:tetratricopeptide (TPR) repeat protein
MQYEISRNYLMFNLTERQLSLLERSAEGARRLGDANLLAAAECSASWALMDHDRGRAEAKLAEGERALASATNVSAFSRADCQLARSRVLQMQGNMAGAIAAIREGLDFLDRRSVQTWSRRDLLGTQLVSIYRATERFKEALELSERSLNEVRASGRAGSLLEITALNNHAVNLMRVGEVAQGAELEREALERAQRMDSRIVPLGLRSNHGFTLLRLGQPQQALDLALADLRDAEQVGNRSAAALSRLLASRALLALGRVNDATERLRAAEAVWQTDARMFGRLLIESALHRVEIHLAENRLADAQHLIDATVTELGYPERQNAPGVDRALRLAARIALQTDNAPLAQRLATDALERSRTIARNERASADVGLAALLRARAFAAEGMRKQALDDGALAVEGLGRGLGAEHADTVAARSLVASLQAVAGAKQP